MLKGIVNVNTLASINNIDTNTFLRLKVRKYLKDIINPLDISELEDRSFSALEYLLENENYIVNEKIWFTVEAIYDWVNDSQGIAILSVINIDDEPITLSDWKDMIFYLNDMNKGLSTSFVITDSLNSLNERSLKVLMKRLNVQESSIFKISLEE